jgi:NADPH2:quinone reductase
VLEFGEMVAPQLGPGEVRVRVVLSGVNPGDTKKRSDWLGFGMPFPRVVPHSDGSGVVDAVGEGVDGGRVGRRVWVYGAQSYRPFGTAAQLTVVPADQAVDLPDEVADEVGACLGIPGITAHRAVFGDGSVEGKVVLVQGVLGGVGSLAAQLARRGGATVIGTVRRSGDVDQVGPSVEHVIALDDPDPADAIRAMTRLERPRATTHCPAIRACRALSITAPWMMPFAVTSTPASRSFASLDSVSCRPRRRWWRSLRFG